MWKRIILDEAHHIKKGNSQHYIKRECSTCKAVFALKSSYRYDTSSCAMRKLDFNLHSKYLFGIWKTTRMDINVNQVS
ncbi:hypothetical protein Droror1_Dr00004248 [Drosera rotundifolia]